MKNNWKIATVILGIFVLGMLVLSFANSEKMIEIKTIEGESILFSETLINSASEIYEDDESFYMCSMEENKCVLFRRLN